MGLEDDSHSKQKHRLWEAFTPVERSKFSGPVFFRKF
jgi:hypothetical protein